MSIDGKMPRSEQIINALTADGYQSGDELTTAEIVRVVSKHCPDMPTSSILPADFCDNHSNKDPFSGKYPIFHLVEKGRYVFLGNPKSEASIEKLAQLLKSRNEIDREIAVLIQRPASTGHIGEFVASIIFDIELERVANRVGIDGYFRAGLLSGKSVNVKFYTKDYSTLDINPAALPDYYLILAGPRNAAVSSKGSHSPLVISSVFLIAAAQLKASLREAGVQVGIATSVRRKLWDEFEIYPKANSAIMELSERQKAMLCILG